MKTLNKFLRWAGSSIVSLIIVIILLNIVTLFFVDLTIEHTVPVVVQTVFDHATPNLQEKTSKSIDGYCQQLKTSQSLPDLCSPQKQEELKLGCASLDKMSLDIQEEMSATCAKIDDGTFALQCRSNNFSSQEALLTKYCAQYNAKQITTRIFLSSMLTSVVISQINTIQLENQTQLKYNQRPLPDSIQTILWFIQPESSVQYLEYKLLLLLLLFVIWYYLSSDLHDYLSKVSRLFFTTGLFVLILWVSAAIYQSIHPVNSDLLLMAITGEGISGPLIPTIIEIMPLIILSLMGKPVIILASVSTLIGIIIYLVRKYAIRKPELIPLANTIKIK